MARRDCPMGVVAYPVRASCIASQTLVHRPFPRAFRPTPGDNYPKNAIHVRFAKKPSSLLSTHPAINRVSLWIATMHDPLRRRVGIRFHRVPSAARVAGVHVIKQKIWGIWW
jgi:hypothetical protein